MPDPWPLWMSGHEQLKFIMTECSKTQIRLTRPIWTASWQNKQNNCAPSEDSDQPGHPPSLIRIFAVRMKKAWVLSYPLSAQRRLWSDWADGQVDLCLRWAHSHFVGFVMRRLIYCRCYKSLNFGQSAGPITGIRESARFKTLRTSFCWPVFPQYIRMHLLSLHAVFACKIWIFLKALNVNRTSNVGNCDFNIYFDACQATWLTWAMTKYENVYQYILNLGSIKNWRVPTVSQYR